MTISLHVKGMRFFLSLGVPNLQELVLHFEGSIRVGERKFEKHYLLVVRKWYSTWKNYQMYAREKFQGMRLHRLGCPLLEEIAQSHQEESWNMHQMRLYNARGKLDVIVHQFELTFLGQ